MATIFDILTTIRNEVPDLSHLPEASVETFDEYARAITAYDIKTNPFIEALLHKIGKTIIEQKLFHNKLARFKRGDILSAQDVEEIFVSMAKSEGQYDPEGTNPLGRRNPPRVDVLYHRENRRDKYVITIGDIDFRKAFKSPAQLDTFTRGLINSVYSGAAYDEWLLMRQLVFTGMEGAPVYKVPFLTPDDTLTVNEFLRVMRSSSLDLTFASDKFNKAGVTTWTEQGSQVCFINKDVLGYVDVYALAHAFNKKDTDFVTDLVTFDTMGEQVIDVDDKEYIPIAVIADKDWLRVWDTLSHMEPQRNADGLFTNWFYHVHQIMSLSHFKNAIVIAMPKTQG